MHLWKVHTVMNAKCTSVPLVLYRGTVVSDWWYCITTTGRERPSLPQDTEPRPYQQTRKSTTTRWHPHQANTSVWQLSHFIHTLNTQIEKPNHIFLSSPVALFTVQVMFYSTVFFFLIIFYATFYLFQEKLVHHCLFNLWRHSLLSSAANREIWKWSIPTFFPMKYVS